MVNFSNAAANLKPVNVGIAIEKEQANKYLDGAAVKYIMDRRQYINEDDVSDGDYSDDSAGFY